MVEHQERGNDAWRDGKFSVAADEYAAALRIRRQLESTDDSDDADETRDLQQRLAQADLVANRLPERFSELLAVEWKDIGDKGLQTVFAPCHGKAVAFDV